MRYALLAVLVVLEALLVAKLLSEPGAAAGLVAVIGGVAALIVLSPRIGDVLSFEVTGRGVNAKLREVETRVDALSAQVDRLFLLTMAEPMYENLKKLSSGAFGPYAKGRGLEREIRHLRDIGYVAVESVSSVPEQGANLSDHVSITPLGREFVRLREEMAAKAQTPHRDR
jgi:hypothetical protein